MTCHKQTHDHTMHHPRRSSNRYCRYQWTDLHATCPVSLISEIGNESKILQGNCFHLLPPNWKGAFVNITILPRQTSLVIRRRCILILARTYYSIDALKPYLSFVYPKASTSNVRRPAPRKLTTTAKDIPTSRSSTGKISDEYRLPGSLQQQQKTSQPVCRYLERS